MTDTIRQQYRDWFEDHPPVFTSKIEEINVYGEVLVVCKTSGTNLKGNPMFGVEIRRKTADGFEAVDNALNRPFHDEEEADRYLFRLERMAADYARLADWVTD